ncbi:MULTISPECIES: hypothetical protein [unclassified Streptomyces]|uniref:hypothetical protein n=1 Tax=unclassified Streptomyces TaxID=2593676 RepID=UPI000BE24916|nr:MULTISPECIES: hypothetical protein [unclassified Streptomyces]
MTAVGLNVGVAGTASANGGCRGQTDPGTYPESIQLNPCMVTDGGWVAGVITPETDIQVWYSIMDKPAWQSGGPIYTVVPPTNLGIIGPAIGPDWGRKVYSGHIAMATSHCYYLRVWFVDGSTTYGYAESPGACV